MGWTLIVVGGLISTLGIVSVTVWAHWRGGRNHRSRMRLGIEQCREAVEQERSAITFARDRSDEKMAESRLALRLAAVRVARLPQ